MRPERLTEKDWFADDDLIRVPSDYDPEWDGVCWTTTADFIGHGQIQMAFDDPNVIVCDIEADGGQPEIYLRIDDAGDQDWPMLEKRALTSLATERFRQNDYKPGWDDETVLRMLNAAERNVDDAKTAWAASNDELATKEQVADALNYMLFALDVMEDSE